MIRGGALSGRSAEVPMRHRSLMVLVGLAIMGGRASAQSVLFDFDSLTAGAPLPLDVTVGGITAHLSATGQGYSIQSANCAGVTPTGFGGNWICPSSITAADLLVGFSRP